MGIFRVGSWLLVYQWIYRFKTIILSSTKINFWAVFLWWGSYWRWVYLVSFTFLEYYGTSPYHWSLSQNVPLAKKILRSEFDWYFPFALQCRIPPFISSCFLYSNKAYQSDSINMNIKHKKQLKNLTTGVPEFPWALAESCHSTKSSRMLRAWEINFKIQWTDCYWS